MQDKSSLQEGALSRLPQTAEVVPVSAVAGSAMGEGMLAKHPLLFYFLIALGWSWTYVLLVQVYLRVPVTTWTQLPVLLGPTLAAFIMSYATEGKAGVQQLLKSYVQWCVGVGWYLFALVGIPLIYILGCVVLAAAISSYRSYQPVALSDWLNYPLLFALVTFVGGPFLEEPGWRGYALPRLQEKYGPLPATLLLGFLWAAWHYPQYLVPEWAAQNGGLNIASFSIFTLSVMTFSIILTWFYNVTKGSVLLAILLHSSINTFSVYAPKMFPAQAETQWNGLISFGATALLMLILTKGRLGYTRPED